MSKAQRPWSMPSEEIRQLQSEMARLTAHIARITAQKMTPALRNSTWPTQPSAHVQNTGNCPSGAHLQMFSFHGHCTHNNTSCWAQCPNRASPSNAPTTNTGHCYFCQTRAHPTDQCDRPCLHCCQIRVHRATACPNRNPTMPAAVVVSALAPTPALPLPPLRYVTPVTLHPSTMPKTTGNVNSSSITDMVQAIWSTDLAKKYPHLPWALLKEPFEVEALMAANMVMLVSKILFNGKPLSPAVDTIHWAVEQASSNAQPTPSPIEESQAAYARSYDRMA
uniref:Gag protein n=1 Tax=Romanomermis culicivorax TaxID=13658 RepID=A0A915KWC2_ROMCU